MPEKKRIFPVTSSGEELGGWEQGADFCGGRQEREVRKTMEYEKVPYLAF